jgi:hypothetical protein
MPACAVCMLEVYRARFHGRNGAAGRGIKRHFHHVIQLESIRFLRMVDPVLIIAPGSRRPLRVSPRLST